LSTLSSTRPLLLCIAVAMCVSPLRAEPDTAAGAPSCLDRALPKHSSAQDVEIRSHEGDGVVTSLSARIWWKRLDDGGHGVLVRLLAPPEVAKMSVLVRERSAGAFQAAGERGGKVYLYMPELGRVRRVSVQQASRSLFGTAFGYADLDRLQGLVRDSRVRQAGQVVHRGRKAWLLSAQPAADTPGAPYTKVVTYLDMQTCLPLRVECHDAAGELAKVFTADPARFERVQGIWVARQVSVENLQEGLRSELIVHSISIDTPLPDASFAPASFADEF